VIGKSRVVTFFRMDQATWDFVRQLLPYTRYKKASPFIREGIELLLKQEEEQPSGGAWAALEAGAAQYSQYPSESSEEWPTPSETYRGVAPGIVERTMSRSST
jgi:Arc/MetJ-type ribon-helix-helix transcriptional regulator